MVVYFNSRGLYSWVIVIMKIYLESNKESQYILSFYMTF